MCKVSWCNNETKQGKNGQYLTYCDIHIQYKQYAANAPVRPWLMYKVEKVINNIEYWKNAPLWTRKKINLATKEWMKYLR